MVAGTARYPIAIDVGDRSMRAVQLQRTGELLHVRGCAQTTLPVDEEGQPTGTAEAIQRLCRAPGLKGKAVSLHLPPELVFSFPVSFTVTPPHTLEEALIEAAEPGFPYPIEELVVDYASLDEVPGGKHPSYRAIVVGVHRPALDRWLDAADQAGVSVENIDYGVSSLRRLHFHLHPAPTAPALLCHVGRTASMITVVTDESILAHRNLGWGIEELEERLRKNLDLPEGRQHTDFLLHQHGLASADADSDEDPTTRAIARTVFQLIAPEVDRWIQDVHALTGYVMSDNPQAEIGTLYFYGEGTLIHGLADYIHAQSGFLGIVADPYSRVRLPSGLPITGPIETAPFALALGLAMRRISWL